MSYLKYLNGYSNELIAQVDELIVSGQLLGRLLKKYPETNSLNNDRALFEYAKELKNQYLKKASPLSKVEFSKSITLEQQALGLNTSISRVQGRKLKNKNEIRIAWLFKELPKEFLHAILVHELAHLKVKDHNKAFYQLCAYMEPDYLQIEFDLRMYLAVKEYLKTNN